MKNLDFLDEIIKLIKIYDQENKSPMTKVVNYQSSQNLKANAYLELPETHTSFEHILKTLDEYLKYSVRTNHPQFNNQLNGGFSPIALIGEIAGFITNTSMATYEIAPYATLIEQKLIEKLNSYIGWTDGEGIMVTGGSNANMMAIHTARNRHHPEVKEVGNIHSYAIFVSEHAHYSFKKAVNILGLGTDSLYLIETDERGQMCLRDLKIQIEKSIENKRIPLLVASTSGTTVFGAFDPIMEINKIAKQFNIWHHVDGAWGAPVLLSSKYKHLMEGSQLADSVAWDAHKLMGAGLITSFFLTKNKGTLLQANSGGGKKYLFHSYENAGFDLGQMSLQCGRKVDSLKLWFLWQYLGDEGFANLVEGQMEKAKYFANKIKDHKRFKIIMIPTYLNVCFQILPIKPVDNLTEYNHSLRYLMVKEGKFMLNYSSLKDGTTFFRMVFANENTQCSDLDIFIEEIIKFADAT